MKILVSNDDGIQSPGLLALANALDRITEVWVVAPDREQSACSHSLSMNRPLRWKKMKEYGDRFYAVNGTPTDCVLLGTSKIMPQRPHLIVSGINIGENLGEDITYSGTVSAAIEGAILGIPSFAISLMARSNCDFTQAAAFAVRLARNILRQGLPRNTFLNVNIPAQGSKPRTYKITRMGKRIYGESVQEKTGSQGRKYYMIGGKEPGYADSEDSDFSAVAKNYISITPLHLDWTNYASIEPLSKRRI